MKSSTTPGKVLSATLGLEAEEATAEEQLFSYPRFFTRIWRWSLLIGLFFSAWHWGWVTLRAAFTAAATAWLILASNLPNLNLPPTPGLNISFLPATPLEFLGAHITLLFALLIVILTYNLFPRVMLHGEGMSVGTLDGWMAVPWKSIRRLVSSESLAGERLVVFVEVEPGSLGQLWRVYGLLFGLGPRPGFFLTTDLKGFDNLVATLAGKLVEMREKEAVSEEEVQEYHRSPIFRLILDLPNSLEEMTRTRGWQTPSPRRAAILWVVVVMGWLGLVILRAATGGGLNPLVLFALLFLSALEVGLAAIGIWALGDFYSGYSNWREIALMYPVSQFPRILALPWLALALTAALPAQLLTVIGLGGAGLAGYLGVRLTQVYYTLPSRRSALPGGILSALFYLGIWGIIFSF